VAFIQITVRIVREVFKQNIKRDEFDIESFYIKICGATILNNNLYVLYPFIML
jgi:hypothetical protein